MQLFSNNLNPVGNSTVKLAVNSKWNRLMKLDTVWLSLTCWISVSFPTISGIIHYSGVLEQGSHLFSPWKSMIFVSRLSSILGHTTYPWISQCEYSPWLSKFKKPQHCNAKKKVPIWAPSQYKDCLSRFRDSPLYRWDVWWKPIYW